jgi:8-oxo-dGTP pyrophosphatase MutT (NUDIX family)
MTRTKKFRTVNCILKNGDRILLLRRSQRVQSNPGLWSGVAGRVEGDASVEQTAMQEILEESGFSAEDVRLITKGPELRVDIAESEVIVVPMMFETNTKAVRLNWEHIDYAWVRPNEISRYETVPRFADVLRNLALI